MLMLETEDRINTYESGISEDMDCERAKAFPESPNSLRLVLTLAVSIFIAESSIMLVFSFFPPIPTHLIMFVDSFLLLILVFPALYLSVFRPLRMSESKYRMTSALLREARDRLEILVHERSMELSRTKDDLENGMIALGIVTDNYDKSIATYFMLLENVSDLVFMLDENGNVTYINAYAEKHFQIKNREIAGSPLCFFWCGESIQEVDAAIGRARQNLEPVILNCECLGMHYETKITPVKNNGGIIGMICIARDISERLKADAENAELREQLLHAQKMESIGVLAGGIAHDFNNMLTVIMGNANMGMIFLEDGATGRKEFENVMLATERARELTMKLLTFSRKEKINVKTVCICDVVHDLTSMLERTFTRKIRIRTEIPDALSVSVDANQIQQALVNICNNARDAMPEGGALTIECREMTPDAAYCAKYLDVAPGRYCVIQITDTGCGMPREMIQKAVEPFFTTKGPGKGTGLGLSVSFGIIKSHGGTMHIYSEPGHGTIVKIFLPVAEISAESCQKSDTETMRRGAETLMLVDDEFFVLDIARKILENAGYTVIPFESAPPSIEHYRNHWGEIAIVVLDMIMPDMDGGEAFKALREINPDVKVVLSSGYSANGQAGRLMKDGIRGFIQKPFNIPELCNTIRNLIDES